MIPEPTRVAPSWDDAAMTWVRLRRASSRGALAAMAASLATPSVAAAHGAVPDEPPTLSAIALGWSVEPLLLVAIAAAALGWIALVRRVDREHPGNTVPRARSAAFIAGLGAVAVALLSGLGRYDTALFSIHMVQHLLLTLVAAPLLVLGAPVTLLLRVASSETRRRRIMPILRSRVLGAAGHPIVAWLLFTAVMWGSHFSPLFDLALEDPLVHEAEHALFLGSALLFWWPLVGLDPTPHRMNHPARVLYAFLQMPQNSFLAVAVLFAGAPLYPHYATLAAAWPIDPLADQRLAGGIMWLVGDGVFLVAVIGLIAAWMRHDERGAAAADRRADAALAAIHEREGRLRERVGSGVGGPDPG